MWYRIEYIHGLTSTCLIMLLIAGLASTPGLTAQSQGNTTVYGISGVEGSGAYIDASQFAGSDLCVQVASAMRSISSAVAGAIVDARGINPGGTNTCANSPWNGVSIAYTRVVLLPAGTIKISNPWVIPSATKVIGEGSGVTTIEDVVGLNPMLQMGSSTCVPCMGVTIEDLSLNGNYLATTGILNQDSQEL